MRRGHAHGAGPPALPPRHWCDYAVDTYHGLDGRCLNRECNRAGELAVTVGATIARDESAEIIVG
jgi:hypothetical protein